MAKTSEICLIFDISLVSDRKSMLFSFLEMLVVLQTAPVGEVLPCAVSSLSSSSDIKNNPKFDKAFIKALRLRSSSMCWSFPIVVFFVQ